MPNVGKELSNLDFAAMIGGPLNAVISAQAQSAMTSVDFIKSVGFDTEKKPAMVKFEYSKNVDDGSGDPKPKDFELQVPFLTMVPIPFIRVEETTIDFNAKIVSVQEKEINDTRERSADASAKAGWGWGSARLKVSYSGKKSTSSTSKTERTYSMAVHVRAVQDELPAGTERILSILENQILETEKPGSNGNGNGNGEDPPAQ